MLGEQVTWGGHGRGSGRFLLGHIYYTPHTGWRQSPRERTLSHANQTSCKFQTTLRAGDTAGVDCRVPQAMEEPVVGDPLGPASPRHSGVPQGSHLGTRPGAHRGAAHGTLHAWGTPHPKEPFLASILLAIIVSRSLFSTVTLNGNGRGDICSPGCV